MTQPANLNRITVRGTFLDFSGAPLTGKKITFTPSFTGVLLDLAADVILSAATFTATLDSSGSFSIDIPATDDPDVDPTGFTYKVSEPTGRSYNIAVPVATPNGVLDLIDVVPVGQPSPGTVQLLGFIVAPVDQPPSNPVEGTVWVQLPAGA